MEAAWQELQEQLLVCDMVLIKFIRGFIL